MFLYWQLKLIDLEAQLLEEPLVLTSLVLFFECLTNGLLDFLLGRSVLDGFNSDRREFNIQSVTSGHDVVVVDDLEVEVHEFLLLFVDQVLN